MRGRSRSRPGLPVRPPCLWWAPSWVGCCFSCACGVIQWAAHTAAFAVGLTGPLPPPSGSGLCQAVWTAGDMGRKLTYRSPFRSELPC
eukprot:6673574-Alexandrium_andersonii.AAC.1